MSHGEVRVNQFVTLFTKWLLGMFLRIVFEGQEREVELSQGQEGERIFLDGQALVCDWVRLKDGSYSLILQGRSYELIAEVSGEVCTIESSEGILDLRITDQRRMISTRPIEARRKGLQRIVAEMPGKVVRILVRPGESVSIEQGLLVLEAMKMQNEIRSPQSGTIREVGVVEGKAVNSGDFLLSLE